MQSITEVLATLRRGVALNYANEELAKLLKAIEETQKPGSITVTLTFKPDKTDENAAEVIAKVSTKLPQRDLPKGMVFIKDGEAHRTDPRQLEMMTEESQTRRPGVSGAELAANDGKVIDLKANAAG